jgi:hypothetical protein
VYAIDIADFAKGYYLYAVAQFYFLACLIPDVAQRDIFHMSHEDAGRMWKLFVKHYFGGEEPDRKQLCDYALMNVLSHGEMIPAFVVQRFLNGEAPFPERAF